MYLPVFFKQLYPPPTWICVWICNFVVKKSSFTNHHHLPWCLFPVKTSIHSHSLRLPCCLSHNNMSSDSEWVQNITIFSWFYFCHNKGKRKDFFLFSCQILCDTSPRSNVMHVPSINVRHRIMTSNPINSASWLESKIHFLNKNHITFTTPTAKSCTLKTIL